MQVDNLILNNNQDNKKAASAIAEYMKNSSGADISGVDHDITESLVKVEKGERRSTLAPIYNRRDLKTASEAYKKQVSMGMDQKTASDEMILAAHTLSKDDYRQLQENGFDPADTDSKTFVTIADKIRMALVKGGHDVSITGGISEKAVNAMSGSAAEANAMKSAIKQTSGDSATQVEDVKTALAQADLPTDDDTIKQAGQTLTKAVEMPSIIDQNTSAYLVKNEMDPTVDNIIEASFAGNTDVSTETPLTDTDIRQMLPQITDKIEEAGLAADDNQIENAVFLLKNDVPLTPENIRLYDSLNGAFTISQDEIPQAITDAVKEGKSPSEAMAVRGFSTMDQVRNAFDVINSATDEDVTAVVNADKPLTIVELEKAHKDAVHNYGNETISQDKSAALRIITAQRQLEETRLAMTTESAFGLIKHGVEIDTTELSQLVENLKAQERTLGEALFPNDTRSAKIFDETADTVQKAGEVPAAIISSYRDYNEFFSADLTEIASGRNTQAVQKKAGEVYDTLRTEIRPDLGDSVKKAFVNLDDVLKENDLELTDENRRAVHILAYNDRDITKESVADVKAADSKVQNVFKNMTPGVVMKLIRKGENPLKMSMNELYDKTEEIRKVMGSNGSQADKEADDYADFLWKAQHSGKITDEEEQSFIGLYRLMHQIDVTDGAPIGALLSQGADITMENLMMAVRSNKDSGRDYRIDDRFRAPESQIVNSITDQISSAYRNEQAEKEYQTRRTRDAEAIVTPDKLQAIGGEAQYRLMSPDELASALERESYNEDSLETDEKLYEARKKEIENALMEADSNTCQILTDAGMPDSAINLTAVKQMLNQHRLAYTRLYGVNGRRTFRSLSEEIAQDPDDLDSAWDKLINDFADAMDEPEELAKAEEELYDTAENTLRKSLADDAAAGKIDIRLIQQSVRQLAVMKELSQKKETYAIPVMVGDEMGNMNLKIVRGKDKKKGQVDIALNSDMTGNVYARFRAGENGQIDGKITTDRRESRETLRENLRSLASAIQDKTDGASVSLVTEFDGRTDASAVLENVYADFETTDDRTDDVQTKTLYGIAKSFVETVGDLFR